jgi:hypothetical protein
VDLEPVALQGVLSKITETLAHELAKPTQTAPDWSEFDWRVARAVAAMHGVSSLLWLKLRWKGPPVWEEFLEQQRTHTAIRHERILQLLRLIDQRTRDQGIAAIPLKGVALHALGLYAPGDRPMADIDLLVSPTAAEGTARLIESLGYRACRPSWKEQVFTPLDCRPPGGLGEHSDNAIKIELHRRVCEMLPCSITDVSERLFPAELRPGLNEYPSLASLLLHLLVHAAGAMTSKALRLVHLHDIALVAVHMSRADWWELVGEGAARQRLWWASPPLRLTAVYFANAIPTDALSALERDCPWLLARVSRRKVLSDVSYSHLWVDAFPGIAWAPSVPEFLRYVKYRVRPGAQHREQREETVNREAWASANRWLTLPQGRRIASWVLSRPMRPVTLHAVDAAIAPLR